MNTKLTTLGLAGLFALTSFVAQPVRADEWTKKTEFQFSAPVQIPGKTLKAGKYVFQLADSDSDRKIVQIFSEDSTIGTSDLLTLLWWEDEQQLIDIAVAEERRSERRSDWREEE